MVLKRETNQHCVMQLFNILLGRRSIAHIVAAHVLYDYITEVVLVPARVLVGPFDWKDGALVVVKTAHVVASAVVVLRIKKSAEYKTR